MTAIHFHDIELKRGSSYIDSPKWIKNKKATINPKNLKDSNCFQYAIIAALHHQDISNNPERITKLKPYINNYNWKDINFSAGQMIGISLKDAIKTLLLTFYLYHITKKK